MKKLENILKSNIFILFLILITFFYSYNFINNEKHYLLDSIDNNYIEGYIKDIKKNNDRTTIVVSDIIINFYNNIGQELQIGDYISVWGKIKLPNKNTIPNLFNYQKYLYSINIHYLMTSSGYEIISKKTPIMYYFKRKIVNFLSKYKNANYLFTFVLGYNYYIDNEVLMSYRANGISHLFAISGMHVSLLTAIILLLLKKIIGKKSAYIICIFFLIFYLFLTGFSKSVERASIIFIVLTIKKIYNFDIDIKIVYIYLTCIVILLNPYVIYNNSFLYSYLISFTLILFSDIIRISSNYLIKVFLISCISFFVSLPITINNNFEINLLSPLINIFFVPMISFIIFPLTLISILFPFISELLNILTNFMEDISITISKISFLKIIIPKLNMIQVIIYYLLFILVIFKVKKRKYKYIFLLIIYIFSLSKINSIRNYTKLSIIDVGQGDSILIDYKSNQGTVMIDTGGISNSNYSISINSTIPYLKSLGINKIDYLILTHGDYDHMGEAINLVNNFKVEKVIFNCGEFNKLEKELIKVLNKKKIPYYSCIKELNIDNNKLHFLQTKEYDNENDNSNVIYTEINGYKFMFMGDASITTEKEILKKYNLPNIDVLKVGHHGSRTSSGKEFIEAINPNYSIISVGKNNRYGHPNKEVLNNLKQSKIYRTDNDGSIMFKIKNDKLRIETCSP